MNSKVAERYLGFLCTLSAILSVISTVGIVVPWQHWSLTLDVFLNVNCGCILYGVNTFSTFLGGDVKICHFASYGLTPTLIIGLCLGIYHGYRSCIPKKLDDPRIEEIRGRINDREFVDGAVIVVRAKERKPYRHWMLTCCLSVFLIFLSLSHAVVLTDGYYKTCNQYRKNLVKLLGSRGREIEVIHNRLVCGAIFDFMDYLQPDANNWRRGEEINTGLALQFSIITSWLNCITWISIFIINFIMFRDKNTN